jgi:hypothetical protein
MFVPFAATILLLFYLVELGSIVAGITEESDRNHVRYPALFNYLGMKGMRPRREGGDPGIEPRQMRHVPPSRTTAYVLEEVCPFSPMLFTSFA